jgi:hypothetical protein
MLKRKDVIFLAIYRYFWGFKDLFQNQYFIIYYERKVFVQISPPEGDQGP